MAGISHDGSKRNGAEHFLNETSLRRLPEKIYHGERRTDGTCDVWCEEVGFEAVGDVALSNSSRRPLPDCSHVRNHSPSGFEWGYGGSGPAQLALALLVDALGDPELAQTYYHEFKFEVIVKWNSSWTISAEEIRRFVASRASEDSPF